ncbi:hypothetical protein GCM10023189_18020 [Nibrella saemangeumensis]|uniref:Cytochrome c domain-containing protein n=1 Tax=Nibrella saemangeumensis TaxID=1084526 RepID=A0ABP8MN95_9BACT
MRLRQQILLIVTVLLLSLSSCSYRQRQPVRKPLALNDKAVHGQQVYMMHCQPCHPQGEGAAGWPFPQVPLPGVAYKFRVRSKAFSLGLGKMPSFKENKISRQELDDLVDYLKAMRTNNEYANMAKR